MKISLLLSALLLFCAAPLQAAPVTDAERKMVKDVGARLVAAVKSVPETMSWPPEIRINDEDVRNAYATFDGRDANGKRKPLVVVYAGTLHDIVKGEPDRLAFIMGHELAHILLEHPVPDPLIEKTDFLRTTHTRSQEEASDEMGMALVLAAGYDFRKGLSAIETWIKDFPGDNYSSFEGVGLDHPSWVDRIALLDKPGAARWKKMSAFANGVLFLKVEDYVNAEKCFDRVTKSFPSAWDAWANLGYARLMMYADKLDSDDLRRFDIGQIVIGGFYQTMDDPGGVRGVDEELWLEAVGALRESIRIKPDQPIVQANLGTAYLLKPTGKDVGQAQGYFEAAYTGAQKAKLDPLAMAAIVVNGSVASLAGNPKAAGTSLDTADALVKRAFGTRQPAAILTDALAYNRALLLSRSGEAADRKMAASQLESYLKKSSAASSWWPLAYERYETLGKELGLTTKPKASLVSAEIEDFRLVAGVELGQNRGLNLSQEVSDAQTQLGAVTGVPVLTGTNLRRYSWEALGVEAIASRQILAIFLSSAQSPAIALRGSGIGGATTLLRVGMSREDLEKALGEDNFDYTQLIDPDLNYRFWRSAGIAARVKDGKVVELVVVQVPRKRSVVGA